MRVSPDTIAINKVHIFILLRINLPGRDRNIYSISTLIQFTHALCTHTKHLLIREKITINLFELESVFITATAEAFASQKEELSIQCVCCVLV